MQGCWDSRIDPTTIPQEKWNNKRRRYTKLKADVLQQHWVCPRLKYIDCWLISIQHGMPRIIYLEGTFCFCCAVVSNDQTHPASLFFLIHTHRRAWLLLTDCILTLYYNHLLLRCPFLAIHVVQQKFQISTWEIAAAMKTRWNMNWKILSLGTWHFRSQPLPTCKTFNEVHGNVKIPHSSALRQSATRNSYPSFFDYVMDSIQANYKAHEDERKQHRDIRTKVVVWLSGVSHWHTKYLSVLVNLI